jgi:hypothetical protein
MYNVGVFKICNFYVKIFLLWYIFKEIRVIKSRRMRWAGHAAQMGRGGMHIGYWWESQKERDHLEDQDVDGWTILKWILER